MSMSRRATSEWLSLSPSLRCPRAQQLPATAVGTIAPTVPDDVLSALEDFWEAAGVSGSDRAMLRPEIEAGLISPTVQTSPRTEMVAPKPAMAPRAGGSHRPTRIAFAVWLAAAVTLFALAACVGYTWPMIVAIPFGAAAITAATGLLLSRRAAWASLLALLFSCAVLLLAEFALTESLLLAAAGLAPSWSPSTFFS